MEAKRRQEYVVHNDIVQQALKFGASLMLSLLGPVGVALVALIPLNILTKFDTKLWAQLSAGLGVICVYTVTYCLYLRKELKKKPNFKLYSHNAEKGFWQHNQTGERVCAACKLDDLLSPLHVYRNGWRCPKHQITVGREVEDETVSSPGVNYHIR